MNRFLGWALAGTAALSPAFAQDVKPSPQEEALKRLSGELAALVKTADSDGNGTLNAAEFRAFVPALRKRGGEILNEIDPAIARKKADKDLKKYDKNVDGKLDDEEKKVMQEELRLKEIKDFDFDRDGKLSENEKTAMRWAEEGNLVYLHRKHDTDASGELTSAEIAAAVSSLTGIKVKKAATP
jgi:Ca2+-binding EF-hand superfamily protein